MNEGLYAIRRNQDIVGSCQFCERPHKEVMEIGGSNSLVVRMCYRCVEELKQATANSWLRPDKLSDFPMQLHPATYIVGINPDADTMGWWYCNRTNSFTVRDCESRDEMRELKSDIEYKHTEFFVVDNGDDMGNIILKKHTKAWVELLNAQ